MGVNREIKICALGSLYAGEKPEFLDEALRSIRAQTLSVPIFLVLDGPIPFSLKEVLSSFQDLIHEVIVLEENCGLGPALQHGLVSLKDKFDYVIRFDTDDINLPNRFEILANELVYLGVDIVGSDIEEFSSERDKQLLGLRKVPLQENDISRAIHRRNPFNHPSVAFKIETALDVGGYENKPFFEDWYLWAKMVKEGAKVANLDQPLVRFRSGDAALARRRGLDYAKREITFFTSLYKLGMTARWEVFFVLPARLITRALPARIFRFVYFFSRRIF